MVSAFHCFAASLGTYFKPLSMATKLAKAIASTIFRVWKAADYAREKKSALDWRSVSITSNRDRIVQMSEQ
jgi:hypothetical protein